MFDRSAKGSLKTSISSAWLDHLEVVPRFNHDLTMISALCVHLQPLFLARSCVDTNQTGPHPSRSSSSLCLVFSRDAMEKFEQSSNKEMDESDRNQQPMQMDQNNQKTHAVQSAKHSEGEREVKEQRYARRAQSRSRSALRQEQEGPKAESEGEDAPRFSQHSRRRHHRHHRRYARVRITGLL
ncbi:unnamed protein product [Durusdinium trenchii]|uniref:Uncharacterized protein n=1 Tax=Durusdinium trenchii TaxID=1381693 RepID=A0ABP0MAC9_9DINO